VGRAVLSAVVAVDSVARSIRKQGHSTLRAATFPVTSRMEEAESHRSVREGRRTQRELGAGRMEE
jgi:hypothetical protein